jgi:SAM-dependent methyltransferase
MKAMSVIGEAALKSLVALKRSLTPMAARRMADQTWTSYIQWQHDSSAALFAKYPHFDFQGKDVLEIGCGTGGRTAYLAGHGAKRVVGIDINSQEIMTARDLCPAAYPAIRDRCTFVVSDGERLSDIGQFDIVVLVDCMEHVVSPPRMLKLAHSYTKPGGRFYFSSVGWYHYLGTHVDVVPFANVFFSDETIINVTRWILSRPNYVPNRFDSSPPTARWDGIYNLRDRPGEHLNKITIREMKRLLRYSPFTRNNLTIVGFSSRHPAAKLINSLRHLPVVQEVCHSIAVGHCQR